MIFFTDGSKTWAVLAIHQNKKNELFITPIIKGVDLHFSRHQDGKFHTKLNGKIIRSSTWQYSFQKFDGVKLEIPITITKEIPKEPILISERKSKFDKTILIDIRGKKEDLVLMPFSIDFSASESSNINK